MKTTKTKYPYVYRAVYPQEGIDGYIAKVIRTPARLHKVFQLSKFAGDKARCMETAAKCAVEFAKLHPAISRREMAELPRKRKMMTCLSESGESTMRSRGAFMISMRQNGLHNQIARKRSGFRLTFGAKQKPWTWLSKQEPRDWKALKVKLLSSRSCASVQGGDLPGQ